jgi:hypothetical protein
MARAIRFLANLSSESAIRPEAVAASLVELEESCAYLLGRETARQWADLLIEAKEYGGLVGSLNLVPGPGSAGHFARLACRGEPSAGDFSSGKVHCKIGGGCLALCPSSFGAVLGKPGRRRRKMPL